MDPRPHVQPSVCRPEANLQEELTSGGAAVSPASCQESGRGGCNEAAAAVATVQQHNDVSSSSVPPIGCSLQGSANCKLPVSHVVKQ